MKWLLALLCFVGVANAQIQQHTIADDAHVRVPLQFPFPYYGQVFTESYMFSNGVVGFMSPTNHWCCSGFNLEQARGVQFNYAIMPLQTDLINYGSGRFLTEGTTQYQRYKWENISEYGAPNNLNTFGVEIRPSGFIGMYYQQVNISAWRPVTMGRTGNTDLGEYHQYYHGNGLQRGAPFEYLTPSTGDMCLVNPLFSPSCPGYEAAFTAQQCSINPLYRPSCPGYEQAYFSQQCSLNALYNTQCVGYQEAYHAQQCSLNPLYATTCTGYAQAYFDQQCRLNGLYDRACPNYAEAYAQQNVTRQQTVVSVPQVTTTFSGEVTVSTPVIADPVVNTIVTRQPTTAPTAIANPAPQQTVAEPKQEKKAETKPTQQRKAETKQENTVTGAVIPVPVHEYKAPIILDPLYRSLVKKPIQDNNRSMYHLIMTGQQKHEEMIDGQWRRKGN